MIPNTLRRDWYKHVARYAVRQLSDARLQHEIAQSRSVFRLLGLGICDTSPWHVTRLAIARAEARRRA